MRGVTGLPSRCTLAIVSLASPESTLRGIEELANSGLPAQELLEGVSERIARVIPSDGAYLSATDPETTLAIGPGVVRNLPVEMCQPIWDYEFMVPDYLKFADIAQGPSSVADLHEATGGRPERSARWREFGGYTGFASEVRMTFTIAGVTWGHAQLDRFADSPRFSGEERAWLERVIPSVAEGLRRSLLDSPGTASDLGPGLVLLDADGAIASMTSEAAAWLDEIDGGAAFPGSATAVPFEMFAATARARADGHAVTERARARTRNGVWLTMHGSILSDTDQIAVIIEPAKANDVAPLIVEAYRLTQRELDVTRRIARGFGTSEIAADLFL